MGRDLPLYLLLPNPSLKKAKLAKKKENKRFLRGLFCENESCFLCQCVYSLCCMWVKSKRWPMKLSRNMIQTVVKAVFLFLSLSLFPSLLTWFLAPFYFFPTSLFPSLIISPMPNVFCCCQCMFSLSSPFFSHLSPPIRLQATDHCHTHPHTYRRIQ